jgi:hypothetical protein
LGADTLQAQGAVTLETALNQFPQLAPDTHEQHQPERRLGRAVGRSAEPGRGAHPRARRRPALPAGRRYRHHRSRHHPRPSDRRVEIITGGASAVYGSDAVAGAVNFVLRRNFEGVLGQYQYGETSRGDGARTRRIWCSA